jgi:hypothetical protein
MSKVSSVNKNRASQKALRSKPLQSVMPSASALRIAALPLKSAFNCNSKCKNCLRILRQSDTAIVAASLAVRVVYGQSFVCAAF